MNAMADCVAEACERGPGRPDSSEFEKLSRSLCISRKDHLQAYRRSIQNLTFFRLTIHVTSLFMSYLKKCQQPSTLYTGFFLVEFLQYNMTTANDSQTNFHNLCSAIQANIFYSEERPFFLPSEITYHTAFHILLLPAGLSLKCALSGLSPRHQTKMTWPVPASAGIMVPSARVMSHRHPDSLHR